MTAEHVARVLLEVFDLSGARNGVDISCVGHRVKIRH